MNAGTKPKIKFPLLKDKVAKRLFTEGEAGLSYLRQVVSLAIGIPEEDISKDVKLIHPNIGANINVINSEADIVLEEDEFYVNLEINYYNTADSLVKNEMYLCQLLLRQVKTSQEYNNVQKVYQINLNSYDALGQGDFLYRSILQDMKYHMKRSDLVEIIDINLEKLRQIDYNTFMNSEKSLEKALYIFICDDKERLNKVYKGDKLMKKLIEEKNSLLDDFDAMLYYDRDKMFENACYDKGYSKGENIGYSKGKQERNIEIAKELIKKKMSIQDIVEITGLTEDDVLSLKNGKNAD